MGRGFSDFIRQALVLAIGVLFSAFLIFALLNILSNLLGVDFVWDDFVLNLTSELIGILAVIFIIDRLRFVQSEISLRESLLRRAAGTANEIAKSAIDELKLTGYIDRGILRGRDFSGANLQGVMLEGADLRCAILKNCNLTGAKLSGADLSGTDLSGADLSGAKLVSVTLSNTRFHGAILTESEFKTASQEPSTQSFIVRFKNLFKPQWETNTYVIDESKKTNLGQATFNKAVLISVDLSGFDNLAGCKFENADLTRSNLSGSNLPSSKFFGANLGSVNLTNANLEAADLSEARLRYSKLNGANLAGSTYGGADFYEAELRGTDFRGAKLGVKPELDEDDNQVDYESASFFEAYFDNETILPDGTKYSSSISNETIFRSYGFELEPLLTDSVDEMAEGKNPFRETDLPKSKLATLDYEEDD